MHCGSSGCFDLGRDKGIGGERDTKKGSKWDRIS